MNLSLEKMQLGNDELLGQLRQWLESVQSAANSLESTSPFSDPSTLSGEDEARATFDPPAPASAGLMDLVEAFTALRHEIKLQTKSTRGLQESSETLVESLRTAIGRFDSVKPKDAEAARAAARPLAESQADLYEALQRLKGVMERLQVRLLDDLSQITVVIREEIRQRVFWKRWALRAFSEFLAAKCEQQVRTSLEPTLKSLMDGLRLMLQRLERAMDECGLRAMDCVGRHVDVNCMTVLATVETQEFPPGTVVEEVRPGYLWRDEVLRYAEVRVAQ